MKTIRGKKAVVTGAGSGIGRAIAIALAKEGADVCLVGRDEARLHSAAAEVEGHGVASAVVVRDLAEPGAGAALAKSLLATWPRIDILINNAGMSYYGPTEHMPAGTLTRILAVNLIAPVELTHALLPVFVAQGEAHIVNVSSLFGLVTMRKGAAYQTTKFGLVGFSNTIRAELWRSGIGVTALCPGFVRTPMLEHYGTAGAGQQRHAIPDWLCLSPEQVAEATINAIRRNRGLVVVSMHARLAWWLMRLSPGLFDWLMREGWRPPRRKS